MADQPKTVAVESDQPAAYVVCAMFAGEWFPQWPVHQSKAAATAWMARPGRAAPIEQVFPLYMGAEHV